MNTETYNKINRIIDSVISRRNFTLPYCLTYNDLKGFAWLKILQHIRDYKQKKGKFEAFIYTMAFQGIVTQLTRYGDYKYRQYKEFLERKNNIGFHFCRLDDYICYDENITKLEDQEQLAILRKRMAIAKKRIKKVSDLHLRVFELHFEQNYTIPEIVKILNISFDKTRSICDYSLKLFRKAFAVLSNYSEEIILKLE